MMVQTKNNKNIQRSIFGRKVKYLIVFFLVFLFVTIAMAVQSVNLGSKLAELEQKEIKLLEEKERLNSLLVASSSLIDIDQKAEELGFTEPSNIYYLQTEEFIAKNY